MRNYDLYLAETAGELPGQGLLSSIWRNWQARRSVVRLQDLDDHLLHDIGVTRMDVEDAARSPLSVNAIAALQRLRREPRKPQFRI
jgi:uncharacterized protein YjiS (DUF1127 family)